LDAVGWQPEISTPGCNQQRHPAASLVTPTGRLLVDPACWRRNTDLFLGYFHHLCHRLRTWKRIDASCDNTVIHNKSRRVEVWSAARTRRVVLRYLP
jgi:hypothetical protein